MRTRLGNTRTRHTNNTPQDLYQETNQHQISNIRVVECMCMYVYACAVGWLVVYLNMEFFLSSVMRRWICAWFKCPRVRAAMAAALSPGLMP
mmetsp:Transcript_21382/g.32698  ORF Transcript_21382/g.32698 Transcript_21382/m.32698 type:complete len:92 (+) Transcript_21382:207-482(+)